jgi:predicted Zn-dependent protease
LKPLAISALSCLLLSACATSTESGRTRMVAPGDVGVLYSAVEMQAKLAFIPDVTCEEAGCDAAQAFRNTVQKLTGQLGKGVAQLVAETQLQLPEFNVSVASKDDIGTLSSASGNIIIFAGLQPLEFPEPLLAFLIAREMGHILAKHHEENSATSIGISVAVALLFPVTNLLRGAQAAYVATTTSSSLASSALSFAGSRMVKGLYESDQQHEADMYALRIMAYAGWTSYEVAAALYAVSSRITGAGWMAELQESKNRIDLLTLGPPAALAGADENTGQSVETFFLSMTEADYVGSVSLSRGAWGNENLCYADMLTGSARMGALLQGHETPRTRAKPVKPRKKRGRRH